MIKIWQRYFLAELTKVFCLVLFCFYGLYVIIDYASHTSGLPNHHLQIQWKDLGLYYFHIFVSRAEILIPLALIIAVVKTLCTLNTRNELVALMAGGIKLKELLRPFVIVGLSLTILLFLNEEYLLPPALKALQRIEDSSKNAKRQKSQIVSVQSVPLEDGSIILYQSYDSAHEMFFDAYWIRSADDIYRMKYLFPYSKVPIGRYVDHLIRDKSGDLASIESLESRFFKEMKFNPDVLHETLMNPNFMTVEELWRQLPKSSEAYSERESQMLASFYWKLFIPWLCLFAVVAPAPFCVRFSRTLPVFFIYVSGIFGLIAFYLVLDAALIMAERQVADPILVLGIPFGAVLAFFSMRYLKQ